MKKDKSQSGGLTSKMIKSIILGTVIGAAVCALMLVLVSFIFVKIQSVSEIAIVPVAIFIASASAFIGGYISARIGKSMGIILGSITSLLMFVILLLIGIGVSGDNFGIVSLLRMALMLICGAIGGILGVNKRKRRK